MLFILNSYILCKVKLYAYINRLTLAGYFSVYNYLIRRISVFEENFPAYKQTAHITQMICCSLSFRNSENSKRRVLL